MPGDEPIRVHHAGKLVDRFRVGVPAPGHGVDRAVAGHRFARPGVSFEQFEIEVVEIDRVGNRVAKKNPVGVLTASGNAAKSSR